VVFFEGMDCSRKSPPLSSFRIPQAFQDKGSAPVTPVWEGDLRRAVQEARHKINLDFRFNKVSAKFSCRGPERL
jgi:hypothetical protein